MTAVTDATFQSDVLNSKGLVFVDFWAEWCTPCLALNPIMEEIGTEFKDKVKILKLDVDNNPATQQKYFVMNIPTVKLFKDGELVENFVGVQPKEVYVEAINAHS